MSEETPRIQTLPPGFTPIQATYGDETKTTDVTSSILAKLINGAIDIVADNSLIPALSFSDSVELTNQEQEEIRRQVTAECGNNPNDNKCVETMTDRYTQAKLADKAALQTQVGAIKGERLTLIAANEKGQQRTFYVPKGTRVVSGRAAERARAREAAEKKAGDTWDFLRPIFTEAMITGLSWFFYIATAVAAWISMSMQGYGILRWLVLVASIVYPYSGIFIALGIYASVKIGDLIFAGAQRVSRSIASRASVPSAAPVAIPQSLGNIDEAVKSFGNFKNLGSSLSLLSKRK